MESKYFVVNWKRYVRSVSIAKKNNCTKCSKLRMYICFSHNSFKILMNRYSLNMRSKHLVLVLFSYFGALRATNRFFYSKITHNSNH